MKYLFKKLLIYLSPFILIAFITFLVDPYNLFGFIPIIKAETKFKCLNRTDATAPRGFILWKTIEFKRNPVPNILLGTSRMVLVSDQSMSNFYGQESKNLSIDGANYRTICDLFWMAANTTHLENVMIQADFNTYDANNNYDLYGPVRRIMEHKSNYFLNYDIISDAFALIYYSISKNEHFVQRSYRFRTGLFELTERDLNDGSDGDYFYPNQYYNDLENISEYCREQKINLVFVIVPDYCEVAEIRALTGIDKEYNRFVSDINSLGRTIDLNSGIPFSFKKNNFMDHYHVRPDLADTLLSMIFKIDSIYSN